MSAEATGWVWRNSPYRGAQLLVHLAIADVVNDVHDNEFWMSVNNLARKARVSRTATVDALNHMVSHGHLELLESGKATRTPSRYRFVTRPLSVETLGRSAVTNSKEITQEPKGLGRSAVMSPEGRSDCERCHGRGLIYNATGGFDIPCSCVPLKVAAEPADNNRVVP
jgi:hypothetical protein